MKMKKVFLGLLALALPALMASCSKEGNEPVDPNSGSQTEASQNLTKLVFTSELPESPLDEDGARTSLGADGRTVSWAVGDKVAVFAIPSKTYSGGTASFEFTVTKVQDGIATFEGDATANAYEYRALYPYIQSGYPMFGGNAPGYVQNQASETGYQVILSPEQRAVLGSYDPQAAISVAKLGDNNRFSFRNAMSMLKIQFTKDASLDGEDITEIRLQTLDRNGLWGNKGLAWQVYVDPDQYTATPQGFFNYDYISLTNGGAAIAPTTGSQAYYMTFAGGDTGTNFRLDFKTSKGNTISKKFAIKTPFAPNKIKSINVDLSKNQKPQPVLILKNIPLLDIMDATLSGSDKFVREADGTVDYYKNKTKIEMVTRVDATTIPALQSLDELEYFTNLLSFRISDVPNLKGDVVVKNAKLGFLGITASGITSFQTEGQYTGTTFQLALRSNSELQTISNLPANITTLTASSNAKLTTLDLSGTSKLTEITARTNALTSIDVSKNPNLTKLDLFTNQFREVDVTKNPALTFLNVSSNSSMSQIDLSQNPLLQTFEGYRNSFTRLDFSKQTQIKTITIFNNPNLTSLVFPPTAPLETFEALRCDLRSVDLSFTKSLVKVQVNNNSNLASLVGLNNQPNLEHIEAYSGSLTSIDVSGSPKIKALRVQSSKLVELDITTNPLLPGTVLTNLNASNQRDLSGIAREITVKMTSAQFSVFQSHPHYRTPGDQVKAQVVN